jgi:UDP-N-acetyl-D-glucosamine dehydrogenase
MKNHLQQQLIEKINTKQAVIGILGLGYVGLPLLIRFVDEGFPAVGFDVDPVKVEKLTRGEPYLKHIDISPLTAAAEEQHPHGSTGTERTMNPRFRPTTDFSLAAECDALIICVPTPLGVHNEPDLSYVHATVDSFLPHLKEGQIISLESTTYPGTTDDEIAPKLKQAGFAPGEKIFLVYSPEREDPGNKQFKTQTIPKLIGGVTPACTEAGAAMYRAVVSQVVEVSSPKIAETAKLLENIFRAVNIGLVNEMKMLTDKMGINIWEVIEAAATKPFGFTPFYPGPGLGGHCIPIDPFYLTWKAREYGMHTRFIELAGEVNTSMPSWVAGKVQSALNGQGKAVKGADVLILGVAYKKNVDDMRESPALEIMELLMDSGAKVRYADPYVKEIPRMRHYDIRLSSDASDTASIGRADCVVVVTDHDDFDYEMIAREAKLIVDTRGRYKDRYGENQDKTTDGTDGRDSGEGRGSGVGTGSAVVGA